MEHSPAGTDIPCLQVAKEDSAFSSARDTRVRIIHGIRGRLVAESTLSIRSFPFCGIVNSFTIRAAVNFSAGVSMPAHRPLAVEKSHIDRLIDADFSLTRLVYAYITCAAAWLVFGSLVGEYAGIRLAFPDFGVHPLFSFGRLRPIHTNVVLWGWSSLGMIGLALYVVPRTCQKSLSSNRLAWASLLLLNVAILAGVVLLANGVNNGGQEYREFPWPVMGLYALGLLLLAVNLYRTVAGRSIAEIYIANWYIVAAFLWTIILVGVLFYFVGSGQGTVEALRSLNAVWHFTNFTVAHSHITMYGFVSFLIWGGIYGLLPRLTGREPPHLLIGVHFWFALIGILIYGISLMIGGTEQGESWISGAPFIDSVRLMASYWLWRAVSGSLMLAAHLLFAYNTWRMRPRSRPMQAAEPAGDPA